MVYPTIAQDLQLALSVGVKVIHVPLGEEVIVKKAATRLAMRKFYNRLECEAILLDYKNVCKGAPEFNINEELDKIYNSPIEDLEKEEQESIGLFGEKIETAEESLPTAKD
jgi:hypothetical protein